MRSTIQRFMTIAIALAMMFGMAASATAGTALPGDDDSFEDSDTVTVNLMADRGGYIKLTIKTGENINFGTLDANGRGSYDANVQVCKEATNASPGARYAHRVFTTVNIVSDSRYFLTAATNTADSSFLVDRHNTTYANPCDAPQYGPVSNLVEPNDPAGQGLGPTNPETGTDEFFYWAIDVTSADTSIRDGSVTITYTARPAAGV